MKNLNRGDLGPGSHPGYNSGAHILSTQMCEGIAHGNQPCQREHWLSTDCYGHMMCRDHKNKKTYASLMAQIPTRTSSSVKPAPLFKVPTMPFGEPAISFGTVFGDRALDSEIKAVNRWWMTYSITNTSRREVRPLRFLLT